MLSLRDYRRAEALFKEGMVLLQELGATRSVAPCLRRLGRLASAEGRFERATRLLGAAEAVRGETIFRYGYGLMPDAEDDHQRTVEAALHMLGEAAFAAAWAEGRAMTLEQAVEYALNERDVDGPE